MIISLLGNVLDALALAAVVVVGVSIVASVAFLALAAPFVLVTGLLYGSR